jgi:GTP cyclohydrolase II
MHGAATARALVRGAPSAASRAASARPIRAARCIAIGIRTRVEVEASARAPRRRPRVASFSTVRAMSSSENPERSDVGRNDVDPIDDSIDDRPISVNAMSFDEFSTGDTTFVAETRLPTDRGFYRVRGYRHSVDGAPFTEPVAIAYGEIEGRSGVAVRVHDACFTSEVLGSLKCDCKQQLQLAMDYVQEHDGMVIYLHQEGRGIGLANKLAAYRLQDERGLDTVDANRALGLPDDTREYTAVANILEDMGIKSIRLMTNNPRKVATLERLGVKIDGRIPCIVEANLFNQGYLEAKEGRMKHYLDGSWCYWDHSGSTFDEADEQENRGGGEGVKDLEDATNVAEGGDDVTVDAK